MIGRRLVALLCVLLAHAWVVYCMLNSASLLDLRREPATPEFVSEWITIDLPPLPPEMDIEKRPDARAAIRTPAAAAVPAPAAAPPAESSAITDTSGVDWPLEGKKAAARVLAREAEAERIARMFAGPGGTWASLTKRQRSKLSKFRWKQGVQLEYDSQGNQIYHLGDGCMIVNSGFIACKIGKVKVHGDMFENMREYFDEMRLPETDEGNGTEPEALRPPN
jgi:hypothetical protein